MNDGNRKQVKVDESIGMMQASENDRKFVHYHPIGQDDFMSGVGCNEQCCSVGTAKIAARQIQVAAR